MIKALNLNDKTFEERINEAVSEVPVYCPEWTNFNQSDPGITMLENLSLFETLQQDHINEMPSIVKAKLLKMAGFLPTKGKSARLLISARGASEAFTIPKGHRFNVYDVCFETKKDIEVNPSRIIGVYSKQGEDTVVDMSGILNSTVSLSYKIFGDVPKEDMALYFVCDGSFNAGEELIFYFKTRETEGRNEFLDKDKNIFGELVWEYYTEAGFVQMHARDNTKAFITDGEVRLRVMDSAPAVYEEFNKKGVCIRARLKRSAYDVCPILDEIHGFLFEVYQQDTQSFLLSSNKATGIDILTKKEKNSYCMAFVKEEKGSSYRRYMPKGPANANEAKGRFFDIVEKDNGYTEYVFDKSKYDFGPEKGRGAIKVLGYNEDIMRRYQLGRVLGYDMQTIALPVNNLVVENFCILARRMDENGEYIYDFVRPGYEDEDALCYHLNEREGSIVIDDAGDFIGADLFAGSMAIYMGPGGNIISGNVFTTEGFSKKIRFVNPADGQGGQYPETIEQVRKRFVKDIDTPYTAITADDYERIAKTTPGLYISKTKAVMNASGSEILVSVLPGGGKSGKYRKLSQDYISIIQERLDERRLIMTKSRVIAPVYVSVNVKVTAVVMQHYENAADMIADAINKFLEFPLTDKGIGEKLYFDELFRIIEDVSCVDFVQDLSIRPARASLGRMENLDVVPVWNGIIVPGNLNIEVVTNARA